MRFGPGDFYLFIEGIARLVLVSDAAETIINNKP